MCLIAIGPLPEEKILENANESNPHGIGLAWKDKDGVHWEKGLELKDVKRFPDWITKNCAIHFRWGTAGAITEEMTHPFPLLEGIPLDITGKAPGIVMHNGHYSGWKDTAEAMGCKLEGEMSDSRYIAWLVFKYGPEVLHLISGQRILVFTDKMWMYGSWVKEGERYYSNSSFRYVTVRGKGKDPWSTRWGGYSASSYGGDYVDGCHFYDSRYVLQRRKSDFEGDWYETKQGGLDYEKPPEFKPEEWDKEVTKSGAIIYRKKGSKPTEPPKEKPKQLSFKTLQEAISAYNKAKQAEKEAKSKKEFRAARKVQNAALDQAVALSMKEDVSLLKHAEEVREQVKKDEEDETLEMDATVPIPIV